MDVEAIQAGLATAVANVSGLKQALPSLTDAINPPTFAVVEFELTYNQTFKGSGIGMVEALFSCGIYVSHGDSEVGRAALVGFVAPSGSGSLKAAIETDRTLGGACATLNAERVRGAYRLYTIGSIDYLGATLDVRVWSTS